MSANGIDQRLMGVAIELAKRGVGSVWPRRPAGCVIARDGSIRARGWNDEKVEALAASLERLDEPLGERHAVYLTRLDGPDLKALKKCPPGRLIVADAQGLARKDRRALDEITSVIDGVCAGPARALDPTQGHEERPRVALKLATSLDGRIATHTGESRWITGERARGYAHRLRADADAVLIGVSTGTLDDPELTCRLPGLDHRSPVRVVVDGRLRLPLTSRLVSSARSVPTWLVARPDADVARAKAFRDCGVEVIEAKAAPEGQVDLAETLRCLRRRGITCILAEGGARIAASLLAANLVDRLEWLYAGKILGGDGIPAVASLGLDRLADAAAWRRSDWHCLGEDMLVIFEKESPEERIPG